MKLTEEFFLIFFLIIMGIVISGEIIEQGQKIQKKHLIEINDLQIYIIRYIVVSEYFSKRDVLSLEDLYKMTRILKIKDKLAMDGIASLIAEYLDCIDENRANPIFFIKREKIAKLIDKEIQEPLKVLFQVNKRVTLKKVFSSIKVKNPIKEINNEIYEEILEENTKKEKIFKQIAFLILSNKVKPIYLGDITKKGNIVLEYIDKKNLNIESGRHWFI